MIGVDTTGLDDEMVKISAFAKESAGLDSEWLDSPTVKHVDTDTGITLLVPGFESKRFKALWGKVNKFLLAKQHGKCAYCESMMAAVSHADVEHFRPKAGFDAATGGTLGANLAGIRGGLVRSGYFWLAYKAENYYVSCAICNEVYKKNRFDVLPDSPRPTAKARDVQEQPMFIDPGREDPRQVLRFDPYTALAVPAAVQEHYLKVKGASDPLGLDDGNAPPPPQLQDVQTEMTARLARLGEIWQFLYAARTEPEMASLFTNAPPPPDDLTREAEAATRSMFSSGTSGGLSLDPDPTVSPSKGTLNVDRQ